MNVEVILAKIDESVKSAHKRIDRMEENQEEIRDLATSTKLLAQTVAMQQKDIDKINKNIESINEKPSKWIDLVKSTIISAFFSGIIAALVALIIKK